MNPDQYKVIIPSYRRAATLAKKTIAMLGRHGIDPARIFVVVADGQQLAEYKAALPTGSYSEILVGVPGKGAVVNWIQQHFADGDLLWSLDDDVKELCERVDEKKKQPVSDLHGFVVGAFTTMLELGFGLWGIYPVLNPFFMKDGYTTDLRLIVGHCWGATNRHGRGFGITTGDAGEKDDSERTIQYYLADGGVLRFSNVASETKCYGVPGGMTTPDRKERQVEAVQYLLSKYPDLCHIAPQRKAGYPEIRLKDARTKGPVFF